MNFDEMLLGWSFEPNGIYARAIERHLAWAWELARVGDCVLAIEALLDASALTHELDPGRDWC